MTRTTIRPEILQTLLLDISKKDTTLKIKGNHYVTQIFYIWFKGEKIDEKSTNASVL